jgi:hypothetical protein
VSDGELMGAPDGDNVGDFILKTYYQHQELQSCRADVLVEMIVTELDNHAAAAGHRSTTQSNNTEFTTSSNSTSNITNTESSSSNTKSNSTATEPVFPKMGHCPICQEDIHGGNYKMNILFQCAHNPDMHNSCIQEMIDRHPNHTPNCPICWKMLTKPYYLTFLPK